MKLSTNYASSRTGTMFIHCGKWMAALPGVPVPPPAGALRRDHHLRAGDRALQGARLAAEPDLRGDRRAGHPLHRRGRDARGQPDAEASDGGDARRDGGGVRRHRPPAAGRPVVPARGVAGRDAGEDERRRLLARSREPLHLLVGPRRAAASWRWPTSGPTSRRCSATSRGSR